MVPAGKGLRMISAQIKDDDQSHRWLQNETY
jgi:hypothetical protein